MYKHGCEVCVVDVASGKVPQHVPVLRHEVAGKMHSAVRSDDAPGGLRDRVQSSPPSSRKFGGTWRPCA